MFSVQNHPSLKTSPETLCAQIHLTPAQVIKAAKELPPSTKDTFLKKQIEIFLSNKQPSYAEEIYDLVENSEEKMKSAEKILKFYVSLEMYEATKNFMKNKFPTLERDWNEIFKDSLIQALSKKEPASYQIKPLTTTDKSEAPLSSAEGEKITKAFFEKETAFCKIKPVALADEKEVPFPSQFRKLLSKNIEFKDLKG